jgi:hypothetical protein
MPIKTFSTFNLNKIPIWKLILYFLVFLVVGGLIFVFVVIPLLFLIPIIWILNKLNILKFSSFNKGFKNQYSDFWRKSAGFQTVEAPTNNPKTPKNKEKEVQEIKDVEFKIKEKD